MRKAVRSAIVFWLTGLATALADDGTAHNASGTGVTWYWGQVYILY
jgi:hypothetical protein